MADVASTLAATARSDDGLERSRAPQSARERWARWYKFSRNPLSVVGLAIVLIVVLPGDLCALRDALSAACRRRSPISRMPSRRPLAVPVRHRRDRARHPEPDHLCAFGCAC